MGNRAARTEQCRRGSQVKLGAAFGPSSPCRGAGRKSPPPPPQRGEGRTPAPLALPRQERAEV